MLFIFSQGWGACQFFSGSGSLIYFPSGSGSDSCFFFKRLRLQGVNNTWLRPAPQPWQIVIDMKNAEYIYAKGVYTLYEVVQAVYRWIIPKVYLVWVGTDILRTNRHFLHMYPYLYGSDDPYQRDKDPNSDHLILLCILNCGICRRRRIGGRFFSGNLCLGATSTPLWGSRCLK